MKGPALGLAAALALCGSPAFAQFTYRPAGELVSGSGRGRPDMTSYAPGMRFPIESAPAYANSQVWGVGGNYGPSGSQCDARNRSYPWRDNYCESRSWDMPMCPSGTGHQGQDIRAANCQDNVHWSVAAATGRITNVGSYSVYLMTDDGTRYDYLHLRSVQVAVGARVVRGDRIGRVSNNFGGTATTIHLHFNIQRAVSGFGNVYAPTYGALIEAYQRLLSVTNPTDAGVVPRDVPVVVDVPRDVPRDIGFDVARDVPVDVARDVGADIPARVDVPGDVPRDVPLDVARDVPRDNGVDVPAARDLGPAPIDVGTDTGPEAVEDASADAGVEASPVEESGCGCRTQPPRTRRSGAWLMALAVLGLRRRRGLSPGAPSPRR